MHRYIPLHDIKVSCINFLKTLTYTNRSVKLSAFFSKLCQIFCHFCLVFRARICTRVYLIIFPRVACMCLKSGTTTLPVGRTF